MYIPSLVIVGVYFEKRRAFATGISLCGSGIGTFVFPPLCEKLIQMYSWKGATWIVAGVCLNGAVCGALYRPLKMPPKPATETTKSKQITVPNDQESHMEIKAAPYQSRYRTDDEDGNRIGKVLETLSAKNSSTSLSSAPSLHVSISCDGIHNSMESQWFDDQKNTPYYEMTRKGSQNVLICSSDASSIQTSNTTRCRDICEKLKTWSTSVTSSLRNVMDFSLLRHPVVIIHGLACIWLSGKLVCVCGGGGGHDNITGSPELYLLSYRDSSDSNIDLFYQKLISSESFSIKSS